MKKLFSGICGSNRSQSAYFTAQVHDFVYSRVVTLDCAQLWETLSKQVVDTQERDAEGLEYSMQTRRRFHTMAPPGTEEATPLEQDDNEDGSEGRSPDGSAKGEEEPEGPWINPSEEDGHGQQGERATGSAETYETDQEARKESQRRKERREDNERQDEAIAATQKASQEAA